VVSLSHLAAGFLLTTDRTTNRQSLHAITVVRDSVRIIQCETDQARSRAIGSSVNHVDSKVRRYAEDNRTESNLRTGKSEAEVSIILDAGM